MSNPQRLRFATSFALLFAFAVSAAAAAPLRVLAYKRQPWAFPDKGAPAGLELEILQYYANANGLTLDVRWYDDFDQILPALARGEGDVAAATITITDERRERFDFSSGYFPVRAILVEPKGQNTRALGELAGGTLATLPGTTYEQLLSGVPGVRFVYADTSAELLGMVASGRARATVLDSSVALIRIADFPTLRLGMALTPEQQYGFAVPKGSPLAQKLSRHLALLRSTSLYYRLVERSLGRHAAEVVTAGRGG
jgi:ABC-type amino acid transport substrate-binding protein